MNTFLDYNRTIFSAFETHAKQQEIIDKKNEIIDKVLESYNYQPNTFLVIGFNPVIFSLQNRKVYVAEIDSEVLSLIQNKCPSVKEMVYKPGIKYDCVIALDEYLTFCSSDEEFKKKIEMLSKLTNHIFITSIKDYKNQDFKDREYSIPALSKNTNKIQAYTEIHDWSAADKNNFKTHLYELNESSAKYCGRFDRKPVYFKQLARFCTDFGASDFLVHKNLMYKSLIKKNYEHVISINFNREFDN